MLLDVQDWLAISAPIYDLGGHFMTSNTPQLSDAEAQAQLVWLTSTAPGELINFAGGAVHAPVFDERTIDYLDGIEETVKRLKQYARKNESDEPVISDAERHVNPPELQQHRKTDKELEQEEKEAAKAAEQQAEQAAEQAAKNLKAGTK